MIFQIFYNLRFIGGSQKKLPHVDILVASALIQLFMCFPSCPSRAQLVHNYLCTQATSSGLSERLQMSKRYNILIQWDPQIPYLSPTSFSTRVLHTRIICGPTLGLGYLKRELLDTRIGCLCFTGYIYLNGPDALMDLIDIFIGDACSLSCFRKYITMLCIQYFN